jgi:hypothetical protein
MIYSATNHVLIAQHSALKLQHHAAFEYEQDTFQKLWPIEQKGKTGVYILSTFH